MQISWIYIYHNNALWQIKKGATLATYADNVRR